MEEVFFTITDNHCSAFYKGDIPEILGSKGEKVKLIADHQGVVIVEGSQGTRFSIPQSKLTTYVEVKPKTENPCSFGGGEYLNTSPSTGAVRLPSTGGQNRKSKERRIQDKVHSNKNSNREESGSVQYVNQQTLF